MCRIISFPRFSRDIPKKLMPLPLLYLANMLTGLKSTAGWYSSDKINKKY